MTPVPAGAPAWVWLVGLALFVGVPGLTSVAVALVQRPLRREQRAQGAAIAQQGEAIAEQKETLSAAATVAEQIRYQVENDHDRNLREDVDVLTGAVELVGTQLGKVLREHRRTKVKLDRMHGDLAETRDKLDDHLVTATD